MQIRVKISREDYDSIKKESKKHDMFLPAFMGKLLVLGLKEIKGKK